MLRELDDRVVLDQVTCPPASRSGHLGNLTDLSLEDQFLELDFSLHPNFEPIDFRFMDTDFDLHLRKVRDHQKGLLFANDSTFGDVRSIFPSCHRRKDHHAFGLGANDAVFKLFLFSFEACLF